MLFAARIKSFEWGKFTNDHYRSDDIAGRSNDTYRSHGNFSFRSSSYLRSAYFRFTTLLRRLLVQLQHCT